MNRGQRTLLLLIGLTAAPFILAQLAYKYYESNDAPRDTTNKGTLVQPATTVAALKLQPLPGPALPDRKWRLLLYRPAQCNAACRQDVQRLRAIPILVGEERTRIAIAMIVDDPHVAATPADNPVPVMPRVQAGGRVGTYTSGLLLVDPQGNVVLWYDSARIGAPLLHDLKFLLKNSSIG